MSDPADLVVWIPHRFPGENEILKARKSKFFQYTAMKARFTGIVEMHTMSAINRRNVRFDSVIVPFPAVTLRLTYCEERTNRDPDNIAAAKKFILDGLVKAGIIQNDGWKQVLGWQERFRKHRQAGILVEIWGHAPVNRPVELDAETLSLIGG